MSPASTSLDPIRSRMTEAGPDTLSDHELLALLMGGGVRQGPIGLAEQTLAKTGGVTGLGRIEVDELARLPGIGPARACLLKAAVELGRRLSALAPPVGKPIHSSTDVAEWFRCRLQDEERECIYALLLDSKHRLLKNLRVTEGSWSCCPVDPKVIFAACLRQGSGAIILVHNHPSGDTTPSREDLELTERLVRAGQVIGVKVLDHLIVGRGGFTSLADAGLL
jgi:DNA repair protein RadC